MSAPHVPPTRAQTLPNPRLDTRNLGSAAPGGLRPAHSPTVAEELPTNPPPKSRGLIPQKHARTPRLGPKWHKDFSEIDLYEGRVLVIDFVKQDEHHGAIRKVAAQEIFDIEGLRKIYSNRERNNEAVLRVFHVQNAEWATKYLLRKFNIDNRDDLVGTDFGRYVRHRRPERRGGKPFLSGKTWKVQYDPWRGISKTSFGMDYLKQYPVRSPASRPHWGNEDESLKMMEMNCFDEEDNSKYGYDVYVQRVSCYIQHKQTTFEPPTDPDIRNPYFIDPKAVHKDSKNEYIPRLNTLDNGNAILIFDNSHSGSIEDTLIAARQTWEARWRRLPFFLAFESRDLVANDDQLAFQCSRIILEDIFKAAVVAWDVFLDLAFDHVSILEDKIYEQPANETRAPELWTNSSLWLKVEKLMFVHIDVVKEMKTRLGEMTDDMETDDTWLDNVPSDYDRLSNLITEDLIKPTENLIKLLYQSVSIRDSRDSIQLGVSMWRLSWITFIFLPMTFITGFFGMNVDTFAENPSIKWYFITSVPFMLAIIVVWYTIKHLISRQRQTPYQRSIYENFFHDMANRNPTLWSRTGPRSYVVPTSRLGKLKWGLIKRWSAPGKTIGAVTDTENAAPAGEADLGFVSKFKRYLIRRWTNQIAVSTPQDADQSALSLEAGDAAVDETASIAHSVVAEGLAEATEMLTIPATPTVVEQSFDRLAVPSTTVTTSLPRFSFHRYDDDRPRSRSPSQNSAILVEEEDWNWLSERGVEGKGWRMRSSSSRDRTAKHEGVEDERQESRERRGRSVGGVKDDDKTQSDGEGFSADRSKKEGEGTGEDRG
ncbi:hypothetical protein AJ80_07511 [Polytolypa hystricis UAMH7299]|uniref:Magnesium and cobalt transporter CorA n=1 Tax=Polytolypa hystricis (strain UAMH7299) TaxID=1447883 RepID=A0A2B7XPE4_POLH7|nr:hypothetical protein AJ80_07511 [Polytolypa hystricis UAMH7299]